MGVNLCVPEGFSLSLLLPHSMLLLKRLETMDTYVLYLFTHEKVKGGYAAFMQNDFHKVLFLEYQPELTDCMSNAKHIKL